MANHYVTINNKRYRTTGLSYAPEENKARQINTTLGGRTLAQTFAYTAYRWTMELLVELTPADANYGSYTDLQTAYGLAYVSFTNPFGTTQDVIFEGKLVGPPKYALVDPTVPFKVSISLRKRQVS